MIEFRAEHFSLDFENEKKWYPAVTDFNMHIDAGEMVALIGESGCGKSITALSMMGLQPPHNTKVAQVGRRITAHADKCRQKHIQINHIRATAVS